MFHPDNQQFQKHFRYSLSVEETHLLQKSISNQLHNRKESSRKFLKRTYFLSFLCVFFFITHSALAMVGTLGFSILSLGLYAAELFLLKREIREFQTECYATQTQMVFLGTKKHLIGANPLSDYTPFATFCSEQEQEYVVPCSKIRFFEKPEEGQTVTLFLLPEANKPYLLLCEES